MAGKRPFPGYPELVELRYELIEQGYNIERFHATDDRQAVRDRVFDIIKNNKVSYRIDSLIVEKRKTGPALQKDIIFYPRMFGYLTRYVLKEMDLDGYEEIIVFTDTIPLQNRRRKIEGEVKSALKEFLTKDAKFRVMHHSSKSNIGIQMVDYCSWAIFRKWEGDDKRSYVYIRDRILSEFEIFKTGTTYYY